MADRIDMQQLLKHLDELGKPLNAKLDKIEDKLSTHATKEDLLRLREELTDLVHQVDTKITVNYVQKELYETRHNQLIQRDQQLDEQIRAERSERDRYMTEVRDLLRQGEQRSKLIEESIDKKLKEHTDSALSTKNGVWARAAQIAAWVALGMTIVSPFISYALTHMQFH